MTNSKPREDPSTEQILASIGRIVSEGEGREPSREGDDVLDLVDAVDEQGNPVPLERAFEGASAISAPPPADPSAPRPATGGRTDEERVLETLRPMLQAWLETHMPPIVERLVRREIERAARRSEPE